MYLKSSYTGEHENMFPNRNTCIPFHYTRVETLCMYFYVYNQAVERGDHVEINISQVNLKLSVCKQKHPITSSPPSIVVLPFPTWTFSVFMQFLFHFGLVENVKMHDGKFGMNIILEFFPYSVFAYVLFHV